MLSTYISSLHNPNFLTRLHQKLHLHQSPDGDGAASDLRSYYETRPGLRKYTLGVELDRMDYELIPDNGKRALDKDVIRSYFGVGCDGERMERGDEGVEGEGEVVATTEELLIRSANQSLLADMLVSLTSSEEHLIENEDDFFDQEERKQPAAGLIYSGHNLCMTSIAETCKFIIDLQSGKVDAVCSLAISVPFHHHEGSQHQLGIIENGRLTLARANVSVRFRPGDIVDHDEPTVQYAVQSVTPLHTLESALLRDAAVSLARDADDPFFQNEYTEVEEADTTDARDVFLLSHHLLSDTGLLAPVLISEHIEKLGRAAEAHTSGFKSAMRQLDGVTNVSAKLQFLKDAAGRQWEEIEAAEREAADAAVHRGVPPPPPPSFPRPEHISYNASIGREVRQPTPPPPPPPPGPTPSRTTAEARPLIGGLLMSGLSRLAAAAAQPDDHQQGDGGGTGLTPPGSPPDYAPPGGSYNEQTPTLYRREVDESQQDTHQLDHFKDFTALSASLPTVDQVVDKGPTEDGHDVDDAGWSDDEFDFEDEPSKQPGASPDSIIGADEPKRAVAGDISSHAQSHHRDHPAMGGEPVKPIPPPPPPPSQQEQQPKHQHQRTFDEEFVIILKEKIDSEIQEMEETGRMKRWTPISEDPALKERLMSVMVAQINS